MKKAFAVLVGLLLVFSLAGTSLAHSLHYRVVGHSMAPVLHDGDVVEIVSEHYEDGDLVVAVKKDGTKIVKRFMGDRLVSVGGGTSYAVDEVTILGAARYSPHDAGRAGGVRISLGIGSGGRGIYRPGGRWRVSFPGVDECGRRLCLGNKMSAVNWGMGQT